MWAVDQNWKDGLDRVSREIVFGHFVFQTKLGNRLAAGIVFGPIGFGTIHTAKAGRKALRTEWKMTITVFESVADATWIGTNVMEDKFGVVLQLLGNDDLHGGPVDESK